MSKMHIFKKDGTWFWLCAKCDPVCTDGWPFHELAKAEAEAHMRTRHPQYNSAMRTVSRDLDSPIVHGHIWSDQNEAGEQTEGKY